MMIQSELFENCRRISRKSQPSSKRDWDMLWRLVKQNRLETKRIYMNSLRNYERDHTKTVLRTTCQSKFPPKNLKTWTFGLDLRRIDRSLRTRYAVRFFRHFAFTCLPFFVTLFQQSFQMSLEKWEILLLTVVSVIYSLSYVNRQNIFEKAKCLNSQFTSVALVILTGNTIIVNKKNIDLITSHQQWFLKMKNCSVERLIKRLDILTLIGLAPWSEVWAWHCQVPAGKKRLGGTCRWMIRNHTFITQPSSSF